jgi:hypothetical protein
MFLWLVIALVMRPFETFGEVVGENETAESL